MDGHRLGIKIGMVLFLANRNLAFFPIRVPISIRGRAKSVLSVNWFTSRRRREDKIFHFFTELWIRIRMDPHLFYLLDPDPHIEYLLNPEW